MKKKSSAIFRLTKPSLVDFLRMCDRNRWCQPRIRYASIRSKPDLCHDLEKFFEFKEDGEFIQILAKRAIPNFPIISYHPGTRRFWKDGILFDAAKESRQKPRFHFERKTVTLRFGELHVAPDSGTSSAFFRGFLAPN